MIDRVSRRRVVVTTVRQGHRLKWEQEGSRNHSWSELVEGDSEPVQPIAVTFPASSEAIDALLGTKRGSPRVVPDETKLAITNCASRGTARSKIIGAMGHRSLLYRRCSSIILFDRRTAWPVRFSYARSLGRSRSAAQLDVGNAPANQSGQ